MSDFSSDAVALRLIELGLKTLWHQGHHKNDDMTSALAGIRDALRPPRTEQEREAHNLEALQRSSLQHNRGRQAAQMEFSNSIAVWGKRVLKDCPDCQEGMPRDEYCPRCVLVWDVFQLVNPPVAVDQTPTDTQS